MIRPKAVMVTAIMILLVLVSMNIDAANSSKVVRFRLYEGFRESLKKNASVFISYGTQEGQYRQGLPKVALDKEMAKLKRVYNLKHLKLIARDTLNLAPDSKSQTALSQEIVLKDRRFMIQLIPDAVKADVFKLKVLEKQQDKKNLVETDILMPQGKVGCIGFEGVHSKVYFLSVQRMQDRKEREGKTMKVIFFERPQLIRRVDPGYPAEALDKWIQGTVTLDTEIDRKGNVISANVLKGADPILDSAALEAVKQWKYQPFEPKGSMDTLIFTVDLSFRIVMDPHSPKNAKQRIKPKLRYSPPPQYPRTALAAKIQGDVILECVADTQGNVVKVKVIEGHRLLRRAAVKAVKQWKFEPYLIDGVPKPVVFTEIVKFNLNINR